MFLSALMALAITAAPPQLVGPADDAFPELRLPLLVLAQDRVLFFAGPAAGIEPTPEGYRWVVTAVYFKPPMTLAAGAQHRMDGLYQVDCATRSTRQMSNRSVARDGRNLEHEVVIGDWVVAQASTPSERVVWIGCGDDRTTELDPFFDDNLDTIADRWRATP